MTNGLIGIFEKANDYLYNNLLGSDDDEINPFLSTSVDDTTLESGSFSERKVEASVITSPSSASRSRQSQERKSPVISKYPVKGTGAPVSQSVIRQNENMKKIQPNAPRKFPLVADELRGDNESSRESGHKMNISELRKLEALSSQRSIAASVVTKGTRTTVGTRTTIGTKGTRASRGTRKSQASSQYLDMIFSDKFAPGSNRSKKATAPESKKVEPNKVVSKMVESKMVRTSETFRTGTPHQRRVQISDQPPEEFEPSFEVVLADQFNKHNTNGSTSYLNVYKPQPVLRSALSKEGTVRSLGSRRSQESRKHKGTFLSNGSGKPNKITTGNPASTVASTFLRPYSVDEGDERRPHLKANLSTFSDKIEDNHGKKMIFDNVKQEDDKEDLDAMLSDLIGSFKSEDDGSSVPLPKHEALADQLDDEDDETLNSRSKRQNINADDDSSLETTDKYTDDSSNNFSDDTSSKFSDYLVEDIQSSSSEDDILESIPEEISTFTEPEGSHEEPPEPAKVEPHKDEVCVKPKQQPAEPSRSIERSVENKPIVAHRIQPRRVKKVKDKKMATTLFGKEPDNEAARKAKAKAQATTLLGSGEFNQEAGRMIGKLRDRFSRQKSSKTPKEKGGEADTRHQAKESSAAELGEVDLGISLPSSKKNKGQRARSNE